MPSSPSSFPCDNGPTVSTGVGDTWPFVSTSRTRPDCSATNMCVSWTRQASAIGLSRPDTTLVSVTCTAARFGAAAGGVVVVALGRRTVVAVVPVVAVTRGAGLVGGIGGAVVDFDDDPLLHAASVSASAPTATHERRTSGG